MGIMHSKQQNIEQTKLITTIYCDHCKRGFLFNDYYKHIRECTLNKMNKLNKKHHSINLS